MVGRVRRVAIAIALVVSACGGPSTPTKREGEIRGTVRVSEGSRGSAWLFLYPRGQGYPLTQAIPDRVTAVPDLRLANGDTGFVFSRVEPNAYRLWGFLDTNLNFDPDVDVLGGPGAGDRVAVGEEVNLQPGEALSIDLTPSQFVQHEPPAFTLAQVDPGTTVELADQPSGVVTLELSASDLGILDPQRTGFVVGLGDADGDGVADDANGDGIPDLFPQIYLRFLRKPGQVVPLDSKGNPAEVIVPLAFSPGAFLAQLAGDPKKDIVVDRLQTALIPQAQAITFEAGRGRVVTAMDAIPVGDYELWVVSESGQFWRMPNDLRNSMPTQAVRFRFVHAMR